MINNPYTLTLLKAFDILNCFDLDDQEISIKEISARIEMPQSSVYRIIQSLEFVGMIFQNKETKKYRLGTKFISLSRKQSYLSNCLQIVTKQMELLGKETGETVNLATLNCDKITYIHRVECQHILRPNFVLNASYPAYKTGLGTVLLAELSDASLQWISQNDADDIGCSYSYFVEVLRSVRRDGYAFDDQVFSPGLRCVAAPVKGPGGKSLFAISVSAPIIRMSDETYLKIRDLVVKRATAAAEEIMELG